MEISYDIAKNAQNLAKGRPSFEAVVEFDFDTAVIIPDDRKDYGEERFIAYGWLGKRVHVLVFAEAPTGIRVISFRKANKREVSRYENAR